MKKFLLAALVAFLLGASALLPASAQTTLLSYSPTGHTTLSVSGTSSNVALPTNSASTPSAINAVLTNTGSVDAYFALGGSSVTVTASNGYLVRAGTWIGISIGQQTYIAAITASSTTTLDISTGRGTPEGSLTSSSGGGGGGSVTQGTTPWLVAGQGTAGSPGTAVLTVQGVGSGTPVPVSGTVTASNPSVSATGSAVPASATQIGVSDGTNLQPGRGDTTNGLWVNVKASVALPAGSAIVGKVGIDQTTPGTTNGVQINAALPAGTNLIGKTGIDQTTPGTTNGVVVTTALPAGSNIVGNVRIDQTTAGTTNGVQDASTVAQGSTTSGQLGGLVQAAATSANPSYSNGQTSPLSQNLAGALRTVLVGSSVQTTPASSGGLSIKRLLVANNTTSVVVDASAGQLYGIEAFNNGTTIAYIKLYNIAQGSVTCGTSAVTESMMIPAPAAGGGGFISMNAMGATYGTAITACVTTGYADADATAPAANQFIVNFYYK